MTARSAARTSSSSVAGASLTGTDVAATDPSGVATFATLGVSVPGGIGTVTLGFIVTGQPGYRAALSSPFGVETGGGGGSSGGGTGDVWDGDDFSTYADIAALLADPAWSRDFARAASAALARPVVRVDVPAMAVSF